MDLDPLDHIALMMRVEELANLDLGDELVYATPRELAHCVHAMIPSDHLPNAETLAAMREVEEGKTTRFHSVATLLADLGDDT